MASHQAPAFCSRCFLGTLRGDIEPTGTAETLYGLPTYVARPDAGNDPTGIVVIVPDAMGWELRNTRVLADSYARRIPAVVLIPEFLDGKSLPESILVAGDRMTRPNTSWLYKALVAKPLWLLSLLPHIMPWLLAGREAVARPKIASYLRSLRASPPAPFSSSLKVGIAGFCWGGKYAIQIAHDSPSDRQDSPQPLVNCAFTAHPSLVKLPDDAELVRIPLSVACGDADHMMPGEKWLTCKRILEEKEGGTLCEAITYKGATHGFAVRGDPNDGRQGEMGIQAEDQAVAWFRRHFSGR